MRVTEHPRLQQCEVFAQLGAGVHPAAGVVEIDVAAGVEACILGRAQLVEHGGVRVMMMLAPEHLLCGLE